MTLWLMELTRKSDGEVILLKPINGKYDVPQGEIWSTVRYIQASVNPNQRKRATRIHKPKSGLPARRGRPPLTEEQKAERGTASPEKTLKELGILSVDEINKSDLEPEQRLQSYLDERMVRQAGCRPQRGYLIIGDGCYRRHRLNGHG